MRQPIRLVNQAAIAALIWPVAVLSQKTSDYRGVWRSEGYGYVVALSDTLIQRYEITQAGCMLVGSPKPIIRSPAGEGIDVAFGEGGDVILIKTGSDADTKRFHQAGAASDVVLRRLTSLPASCRDGVPNTPVAVFDVFTRTWAEHYIQFTEKHVDWEAVVAEARKRVTPSMAPGELFDLLSGMIAPFEDAHTSINAPDIQRRFGALRAGTDRVMKHRGAEFREKDMPLLFATADRRLAGALRSFCNDRLKFGHLDDSTGYLRILSESGYTAAGGFGTGLIALEAALDTIFADRKLSGLVLDLRINFGGADPYGLALAARLATNEYVAYSKEARSDPLDQTKWTPGQPSIVRPSTRPGFRGKVVELTGPLTISAGETTTQALMGRQPHILRIGENTQGVFSDVLGRRLPNGWMFGLPNEVFRRSDRTTFDGSGIPPDIEVAVFADADVAAGRDPALERALMELRRR